MELLLGWVFVFLPGEVHRSELTSDYSLQLAVGICYMRPLWHTFFATCGLPIISSLPFWLHTLLRWLFLTLRENSLMPWTKLAMAWDFSPHLIFRLRNPRSHRPWRDKYPPHRFFLRAVAQQRHPVHCYQTNYFSKTFTFLFGSEDTELIHRIWSIYKPSLKWLEVE